MASTSAGGSKRSRAQDSATFKTPLPSSKRSHAESQSDPEEEGDMDMSQLPSQAEREAKSSIIAEEADVGVIEKIELTNFMCHPRLTICLSPNVNFILGRNGSGKSAIMLGIMVGLGSKAASTHRGSSLTQFIRTGASSAEVTVTLRNRGRDAYKSDEYGDKIVVRRVIRRDGAGNYIIKGVKGKVISTKKDELVAILDHCNIQIDNPVSLLSQDTSRHFLHSFNPSSKYKLFMKATHLEQMAQDYEKAKEHQCIMKKGIDKKKELLPVLKRRAKELEEQVQTFQQLRNMEKKVVKLEKELQWALVIEIENTIPPFETDIEKEKQRISRNKEKVESVETQVSAADSDLQAVDGELRDVMKEAEDANRRRTALHNEKRQKEKDLREIGNKLKANRRAIADQTGEKQALERQRDESIAQSQRDTQGEREQQLRQLEQSREKLQRAERELGAIKNDQAQFQHGLSKYTEDMRHNQSKADEVEEKVRAAADQMKRIQSSRKDSLQVFGPWMPRLVQAVERNARRFHKLPKGPLGAKIQLKDYHWARAAEVILGIGLLGAFIADNQQDARELKRIMREELQGQNNVRFPDIITTKFEGRMHNVGPNKAQSRYPTVLDMVEVADVDVLNALIEEKEIETILLIEESKEARSVMREGASPRNTSSAYTLEGDQVLCRGYYSNRRNPFGIFKASVDDAIREQKSRLADLQSERDHLQKQREKMMNEARTKKNMLGQCRDHLHRKQAEVNKLKRVVSELQSVEEEEETQEDIGTYDAEIQSCEDRITALNTERSGYEETTRKLKEELKECAYSIQQFETEVGAVADKMERLQKRQGEAMQKKQQAESKLQHYRQRVVDVEALIAELETKVRETRQKAEEARGNAERVCPRLDTQRARKSIETEISQLRKRINRDHPGREEQERIEGEYIETMKEFKGTDDLIKKERKAHKELHKSLCARIDRYQEIRSTTAQRAQLFFAANLQARGYTGKIKFKHQEEKLEINVNVDSTHASQTVTKNTKSLSGGERSYTTVCFIMSLWEAMEAPFRCLDEFDVFMDMVNRRISMRLMLANAKEQSTRQFIFFTPQDMSSMGIQPDASVKVLRLSEPERDQSTLD